MSKKLYLVTSGLVLALSASANAGFVNSAAIAAANAQTPAKAPAPAPAPAPARASAPAPAPAARVESLRHQAPAPRVESPRFQAPAARAESPRHQAPAPRVESPRFQAPAARAESPRHQAPAPRVESPRFQAPAPASRNDASRFQAPSPANNPRIPSARPGRPERFEGRPGFTDRRGDNGRIDRDRFDHDRFARDRFARDRFARDRFGRDRFGRVETAPVIVTPPVVVTPDPIYVPVPVESGNGGYYPAPSDSGYANNGRAARRSRAPRSVPSEREASPVVDSQTVTIELQTQVSGGTFAIGQAELARYAGYRISAVTAEMSTDDGAKLEVLVKGKRIGQILAQQRGEYTKSFGVNGTAVGRGGTGLSLRASGSMIVNRVIVSLVRQ